MRDVPDTVGTRCTRAARRPSVAGEAEPEGARQIPEQDHAHEDQGDADRRLHDVSPRFRGSRDPRSRSLIIAERPRAGRPVAVPGSYLARSARRRRASDAVAASAVSPSAVLAGSGAPFPLKLNANACPFTEPEVLPVAGPDFAGVNW